MVTRSRNRGGVYGLGTFLIGRWLSSFLVAAFAISVIRERAHFRAFFGRAPRES